jgi:hypothetical protein
MHMYYLVAMLTLTKTDEVSNRKVASTNTTLQDYMVRLDDQEWRYQVAKYSE